MTQEFDVIIQKHLPDYYRNIYQIETTENRAEDFPKFIETYARSIKEENEKQGKKGIFTTGIRKLKIIRNMIILSEQKFPDELMNSVIETAAQTVMIKNVSILNKIDALALLCCILEKYPEVYERNQATYRSIFESERKEPISVHENQFSDHIHTIALRINLRILFSAMGIHVDAQLLEFLSYLKDDIATIISVSNFIAEYLEISEKIMFSKSTENIILNHALIWSQISDLEVKQNATRILMVLLRNQENQDIINRQIVLLVDTENASIKSIILQRILKTPNISEFTKEHVFKVCEHDNDYIIRTLCGNIRNLEKQKMMNE